MKYLKAAFWNLSNYFGILAAVCAGNKKKTALQVAELLRWHCKTTKVNRLHWAVKLANEMKMGAQLQSLMSLLAWLIMRVRVLLSCRACKSHYFRRVGCSYLHLYTRLQVNAHSRQSVRQLGRQTTEACCRGQQFQQKLLLLLLLLFSLLLFCFCHCCWVHRFCDLPFAQYYCSRLCCVARLAAAIGQFVCA